MNLHDVVRLNRGMKFNGNAALAWGQIVRTRESKAHLYDFPVVAGWIATSVYPGVTEYVEPIPACGKKVRAGTTPWRYLYNNKPWTNRCTDCDAIALGETIPERRSYWLAVRDEAGLEAFINHALAQPYR